TTAATATTAGGWATPVATGRARAHTRGAGTAAVAATGTRAAAPAAAPTGRRARRGAATTAGPTARAGRPLAGHGRGRGAGRHRGRGGPRRHGGRRGPRAGRGDAVRVVAAAAQRWTAGRLPAVGGRLPALLGLPGGLDRRLLLSLERGGTGLRGRHLDVVRARRLRHARRRCRHRPLRGLLRRRSRLPGHLGRGGSRRR